MAQQPTKIPNCLKAKTQSINETARESHQFTIEELDEIYCGIRLVHTELTRLMELAEENRISYPKYYVGISKDLNTRLGIHKTPDCYTIECTNDSVAREIERFFTLACQTAGNPGGGDNTSKYVYVYRKGKNTVESLTESQLINS